MFRTQFRSDPFAVRDALTRARESWRHHGVDDDCCGTAEQVLAEVLNNVVEHAHGERPDGAVELIMDRDDTGLRCEVRDNGAPMPGKVLPAGRLADHGGRLENLPEGGFGWFMIRTLTEDLTYRRVSDWNVLSFRIPDEPEENTG